MSNAWLQELVAGDTVVVDRNNRDRKQGSPGVSKVDRTTATQILIGTDRYSRRDGRLIGGCVWTCTYLIEATVDLLVKVRAQQLKCRSINMLKSVDWGEYDAVTLEAVVRMLSKGGK